MTVKIAGRIRGLVAIASAEDRADQQLQVNNRGDQLVGQSLPEMTELVRLGGSWQVRNVSAQAALVNVFPTTTAGLSIWNGDPAHGRCYVIDSVAADVGQQDSTQPNTLGLFCMLNKPPVTAPSTLITGVTSLSGNNYGGKARIVHGATVVNDGWFPAGSSPPMAAAVAGTTRLTVDIPLRGLYIVPPGGMFSVVATRVASASGQMSYTIRWHEVQLVYSF